MNMPIAGLRAACLSVAALAAPALAQQSDRPLDQALQAAFAAGELAGLHGVMVMHAGEVLAESYFPGQDQRWGYPLGVVRHDAVTLHDMRSVSKSVVSLLYGIALQQGLVPGLDAPLYAQFPEYADLASDPARAAITVRHAMTMTMGLNWREDLPYTSPENSEIAMENAPDRIRFALEQPVVAPPGTRMTYSGGATAILAALIARGAAMPLDEYARQVLFAPLGIAQFEWVAGHDGVPAAASGLRLTLQGMTRIGQMVAAGGAWNGVQVVPADWLSASFTPAADHPSTLRYGLQWWLSPREFRGFWVAAMGNGGQRLTVQSSIGLVVAIQAGNYNSPTDWQLPVRVIERHVVPVIVERLGR